MSRLVLRMAAIARACAKAMWLAAEKSVGWTTVATNESVVGRVGRADKGDSFRETLVRTTL